MGILSIMMCDGERKEKKEKKNSHPVLMLCRKGKNAVVNVNLFLNGLAANILINQSHCIQFEGVLLNS